MNANKASPLMWPIDISAPANASSSLPTARATSNTPGTWLRCINLRPCSDFDRCQTWVQVQTRRHSYIVRLLGIKHVVVAINKMDIVDWSEERLNKFDLDYKLAAKLGLEDVRFLPMSALLGDNVVDPSEHMPGTKAHPDACP